MLGVSEMGYCNAPVTATPLMMSFNASSQNDEADRIQVGCVLTGKSGRNWAMWEGVMTGTVPSCNN